MKFIHPLSDCKATNIGDNTRIWQFCVIFPKAVINDNCTVKSGVQLWDGVTLEDNVFIGPNVTFTNDLFPRSKNKDYECKGITLKKGCSIGTSSIVIASLYDRRISFGRCRKCLNEGYCILYIRL